MDVDKTIVVVFEPTVAHCITGGSAGGGYVDCGGDIGSPCMYKPRNSSYEEGRFYANARPDPSWEFLHWEGDATGTNASVFLVADGDKHVEAVFGTSVSASATGPGSLTVAPPADGLGRYPYGAVVSVIGNPQPGHYLAVWGGAAGGSFNPLAFPVTTAKPTISCLFAPIPSDKFLLTIPLVGDGSVSAVPAKNIFSPGEAVTLTAAATGVQPFVGWTGDVSSQETSITVMMDSNKTIAANFGAGNQQPQLEGIADQSLDELSLLTVTATASDPDLPSQALRFSLVSGVEGAVIDALTGQLQWTPSEAQGPGNYPFRVRVTDDGTPPMQAEASFTVTVTEVNTAPTLAAVADQAIKEGQPLALALMASDEDLPANVLKHILVEGPPGMTLDELTGILNWLPAEQDGGTTNRVTVRVTDDGEPALSAERTFLVVVEEVNAPPQIDASQAGFTQEGFAMTFSTEAGFVYVAEWSEDLLSWNVLREIGAVGAAAQVTDEGALTAEHRFYRVRLKQ